MLRFIPAFVILLICGSGALSQPPSQKFRVDKGRVIFHDKVDSEQRRLLALDGSKDSQVTLSRDETVNGQIEYALINKVDELQEKIELDSVLTAPLKVKYVRGLETMLLGFNNNAQKRTSRPHLPPTSCQRTKRLCRST